MNMSLWNESIIYLKWVTKVPIVSEDVILLLDSRFDQVLWYSGTLWLLISEPYPPRVKGNGHSVLNDGGFFSSSALQRERQLSAQLHDTLDEERRSQHEASAREKAAIKDLQAMLDLERNKLLDLQVGASQES